MNAGQTAAVIGLVLVAILLGFGLVLGTIELLFK